VATLTGAPRASRPLHVLSLLEQPDERFERHQDALGPNRTAIARQGARVGLDPCSLCRVAPDRPGEANGADRLRHRAAVRPRDPGHGHRDLGIALRQRTKRHRARHRFADGTEIPQVRGRDSEHLYLGLVGVGDEASIEPLAGSGRQRHRIGDAARRARLGRRQHQVLAAQCPPQFGCKLVEAIGGSAHPDTRIKMASAISA
jgi:hypothetical protein